MKWVGLIGVVFCCADVMAQGYSDAAQTAFAGADVVNIRNGFQDINPASITQLENSKIGISQSSPFIIKDLQWNSIFFSNKFRNNFWAVDYKSFSFDRYRNRHTVFLYGKKLQDQLSLGIRIKLVNIRAEEIHRYFLAHSIGINYRLNKHLIIGSYYVKDPLLNAYLRTGIEFKRHKKVPLFLSFEINEKQQIKIATALEYLISKKLSTRFSLSSSENFMGFGFSYTIKQIQIEASTSLHTYLGPSPCITLCYEF